MATYFTCDICGVGCEPVYESLWMDAFVSGARGGELLRVQTVVKRHDVPGSKTNIDLCDECRTKAIMIAIGKGGNE